MNHRWKAAKMASTGMNATMIEAKNSIQKLPNPVVMYRHNALLNGLHVLCGGEDGAHEVVVPHEHEDEDGDGCDSGADQGDCSSILVVRNRLQHQTRSPAGAVN